MARRSSATATTTRRRRKPQIAIRPRRPVVVRPPADAPYARTLWGLLRVPFRLVVARLEDGLQDAGYDGIRRSHFRIFRAARGVDGYSLTQLARQARITKQSAAYFIEDLESHGYLTSTPHPQDERALTIRLTRRGQLVEREMQRIIDRTEAEWSRLLGKTRFAQFKRLLVDLSRALETDAQVESERD